MQTLTKLLLQDYERGREIDVTVNLCRPDAKTVDEIIHRLRILVFPGFFREDSQCASLESYVATLLSQVLFQLEGQLLSLAQDEAVCQRICYEFLKDLPKIRHQMHLDLQAFLAGDPAAASAEEIIVSYPGYYAILVYRLAHRLLELGVPVLPRMMTEHAHSATGIDIHPGAVIGERFFIDHGTGIVIGQTAKIGNGVKLYQGVTLGALSTRAGSALRGKKRHPTIEDAVTIYAGASILGGDTVIGAGAVIGANAFVTGCVEPGTTVIGHRPGP